MNPADLDDVVVEVEAAAATDVVDATDRATAALGAWSRLSATARASHLENASKVVLERGDDLAGLITREVGKPIVEARAEVARVVEIFGYFAQEARQPHGELIPSAAADVRILTVPKPLGTVAVITPWNFPLAIPAWKIAPALVCGNTVVFKPSEHAIACGAGLVEALVGSGLPADVIKLIVGHGSEIGDALVGDSRIAGVSFTGSEVVGASIERLARAHGARVQLEMGGNNATIVASDADPTAAADLVVGAAMGYAGQKCTATSRLIVDSSVAEPVLEHVCARVSELGVGDPSDPAIDVGPLISREAVARVQADVDEAVGCGAEVVVGGKRPRGPAYDAGCYFEPTVLGGLDHAADVAQREIFGPVLAAYTVTGLDEAIELANDSRLGLAAGIVTTHLPTSARFIDEVDAGVLKVNLATAGLEVQAPFGGLKASSSFSQEQGKAAARFYTVAKTAYVGTRAA